MAESLENRPPQPKGFNFSPVSRTPGASLRLQAGWRFWMDRGGTFTDQVALPPHGPLVVRKVLSLQPEVAGDPAVAAGDRLRIKTPKGGGGRGPIRGPAVGCCLKKLRYGCAHL